MADENSWNEWNKHILKELERLNAGQEKNSEKMAELKFDIDDKLNTFMSSVRLDLIGIQQKISSYEPNKIVELQHDMETTMSTVKDQEGRLRILEKSQNQFLGKWTVVGGVATMIIAALISLFVSWIKISPPPPPVNPENRPVAASSTAPVSGP